MRPTLSPLRAAAALALVLAAPASASAAYAPKLDVKISPSTPKAAPAVTTVVTQAAGETANRKVVVSFPAGFLAPRTQSKVPACTPEQEGRRQCPPETRVGKAQAVASVLAVPVTLDGSVHYGGPVAGRLKLIVFLDNATFNQHLTLEGFVSIRPTDAGFDAVFDGLPDQLTTSFTLSLEGGPLALVSNPSTCGDFIFKAGFTSQRGEQAGSDAKVSITNCPPAPLTTSPLRFEPRTTTTKAGTKLSFSCLRVASARILVKRGTRKVLQRTLTLKKGRTNLQGFGKGLKPGRYRVAVSFSDSDGQQATRKGSFTIRARR